MIENFVSCPLNDFSRITQFKGYCIKGNDASGRLETRSPMFYMFHPTTPTLTLIAIPADTVWPRSIAVETRSKRD